MIATTLSAIVIDGESSDRTAVLDALADRGFRCEVVSSPSEAAMRLDETDIDTIIVHERATASCLDTFVDSARQKHPRLAIIVVQNEYDGPMECRLFDLGVDDIVTLAASPAILAARAALRTKNCRVR